MRLLYKNIQQALKNSELIRLTTVNFIGLAETLL